MRHSLMILTCLVASSAFAQKNYIDLCPHPENIKTISLSKQFGRNRYQLAAVNDAGTYFYSDVMIGYLRATAFDEYTSFYDADTKMLTCFYMTYSGTHTEVALYNHTPIE